LSDDNPYASPQVEDFAPPAGEPLPIAEDEGYRCWRDGDLLVICYRTVLPNRCVKTGGPVVRRVGQSWLALPYWWFLLLLWAPLWFVAVPLLLWRSIPTAVPLGHSHYHEYRRKNRNACLILLLGLNAIGVSFALLSSLAGGAALLVGVVLTIAGAIHASRQSLKRVRYGSGFVWLSGCHPDFLALLPPWPGTTQARQSKRGFVP